MYKPKKLQQIKTESKKTLLRREPKIGVGRHIVKIKNAELMKKRKNLLKLVIESTDSGRKGEFIILNNGYAMDSLVNAIYGNEEEEVYLEELIDKEVIVEVVRNNRYLNIDYFEALELEELEDDLDIDFSDMEFEENEELEDII